MAFGHGDVDPGTDPTLEVAADIVGGVNFQRVKLANPNEGETGAYGIDSDPVRVRNRGRGTSDYDSELVVLPDAEAELFAGTVYVLALYFHNLTGDVVRLNVRNTAGVYLLKDYDMAPHEVLTLERHGAKIVGLHWEAGAADAIAGQVHGWQ